MLAGQPPFTGPTVESLVHQHLSAEPPSVAAVRPSVPGWVAAALERSLAKTPADRFNPVAQFGEAISPHGSATSEPAASTQEAKPRPGRRRRGLMGAAAVVVLVTAVLIGRSITSVSEPENPRTAIAVLPFENATTDEEYAFFAGGLHDELLIQLTKVAALKVISRTSVMGYSTQTRLVSEIADELGVGTIVEGRVQVQGDRLRVSVQLIDAATDEHLWARSYDRTIDDAFAIQSDVAQRVVAAVGAVLSDAEASSIAAVPTDDPEAYRLYLQGEEYWHRPGYERRNLENAQTLYERAIELDSAFALAYAALADVHGMIAWFRYDPSPERLALQKQAAVTALQLEPTLPQARVANATVHYQAERNWQLALSEYQAAREGLPNDAGVWRMIGATYRRLGQWDSALAAFRQVHDVDPRDADVLYDQLGHTYRLLRRYPEAIRFYNQALRLAPDLEIAQWAKGWTYFHWQGELDTLEATSARYDRADYELRLALLRRRPAILLQHVARNVPSVIESISTFEPKTLYAAWAYQLRGDQPSARREFTTALGVLDSVVRALPNDERVHVARGMALAGLGRRAAALEECHWLENSVVYRDDAYFGTRIAGDRAVILAQVGEADEAVTEIERLLSGPSYMTVHMLRADPRYDPIRDDPRFQALLVNYDPPQPVPLN
jgi:serine/threonine-protein kinase